MSKHPVVHFEMPYDDAARCAKFYGDAFGWPMMNLGAEMGDYVMAHTADTDENQMVKTPGTINGGFFKRSPENAVPSVVVSVPDIKKAIAAIMKAGGKVLGDPMPIPGVGLYAHFHDSEGNLASILQPNGM